jgi:potassium/chloride transporter 4/5/6
MIHDGGFMILISWLLQQHKIWRGCKMRVFTVMEEINKEQ